MCYSASASLTGSAILATMGVYTLKKISGKEEIFLASVPLFFGIQQGIEGLLWVSINASNHHQFNSYLAAVFLFFAYCFWPIWVPVSSYFIETNPMKKKIIFLIGVIGTLVSIKLSYYLFIFFEVEPKIISNSIYYFVTTSKENFLLASLYIGVICGSFFISSHLILRVLGLCWFVSSVFSLAFYYNNFTSVWCFYSAILSMIIILYFYKQSKMVPCHSAESRHLI